MKNIICWLLGHKYTVIKKYKCRHGSRKLRCSRCKSIFHYDEKTKSCLPYSAEIDDMMEEQELALKQKENKRTSTKS